MDRSRGAHRRTSPALAAQPRAAQNSPPWSAPPPYKESGSAGGARGSPGKRRHRSAAPSRGQGSARSPTALEPPPRTPSPAVAALGEPRRVRTVTVRPDGSIVGPGGLTPASQPVVPAVSASAEPPAQTAAQTAAVEPAPLEPIAVAPCAAAGTGFGRPSGVGPRTERGNGGAHPPVSAPAPVPPPAPARTSPPATTATAQPAPQPASGPLQLSALQSPAPAPAPSASAASGPTGGYAVQLAIRGSEGRAQGGLPADPGAIRLDHRGRPADHPPGGGERLDHLPGAGGRLFAGARHPGLRPDQDRRRRLLRRPQPVSGRGSRCPQPRSSASPARP